MTPDVHYMSGEKVELGDKVRINDERFGRVVAILERFETSDGDSISDNGPGVMFQFDGWGEVFYSLEAVGNDEDLFLVDRGT
jgi:hypothetical protein